MKTTLIILLLTSSVWACPKGFTEYNGLCSDDRKPLITSEDASADYVSDDKPPRSGQNPWEQVQVDTSPSCAVTKSCSDQVAIDAVEQGKKAAGVPEK